MTPQQRKIALGNAARRVAEALAAGERYDDPRVAARIAWQSGVDIADVRAMLASRSGGGA